VAPAASAARPRLQLQGLLFLLAAVLILLAAWNTGTNLFYVVFGGLVSFVVVSYLFSAWSLRGITVERDSPGAVHRGDAVPIAVRLKNTKRLLPSAALEVYADSRPGEPVAFTLAIPPGGRAELRIIERFDQRGVHPVPAIELVTGFPFGLVERRMRVQDASEVVVYPRVRAVRPAAFELARGGGSAVRQSRGAGDEFFSLRHYVRGDDLRRVAWKASARTGNLLVMELEHETSRYIACVFDNRLREESPEARERFEDAVELVASLAVTMLYRQYRVAIVTATDTLPLGEGPSHAVKVLDMLARVDPAPPDAPNPFAHDPAPEEAHQLRCLCVSCNAGDWGRPVGTHGLPVLDPAEVIHA
jgi:uncharacterized protein (DUF58 family)